MNRISRCDWLPERARWSSLARSGYGLCPARIQIMLWCFFPYNKFFIDQACSVKMARYWPRSFFTCLWSSTSSLSINTQKKDLANIQPSCPHAWSLTHTYYYYYIIFIIIIIIIHYFICLFISLFDGWLLRSFFQFFGCLVVVYFIRWLVGSFFHSFIC